jgi:hypothetical protein
VATTNPRELDDLSRLNDTLAWSGNPRKRCVPLREDDRFWIEISIAGSKLSDPTLCRRVSDDLDQGDIPISDGPATIEGTFDIEPSRS